MVPFLCNDLAAAYRSLLELVVKPQVLKNHGTPKKMIELELDDDALVSPRSIHLGFAAESEIQNLRASKNITANEIETLRMDARIFVVTTLNKISERNPLASVIVRTADAFDPKVMIATEDEVLKQKMKILTQRIVKLKIVTFNRAENARQQYTAMLQNVLVASRDAFLSFNRKEQRLDEFFFETLKVDEKYPDLNSVMIIIFVHGQAIVGRGFNDNNVVLKDNQSTDSVIARRFIKNYMNSKKVGPHTMTITSGLIRSVRYSHQRYLQYLDSLKQVEKKNKKKDELVAVENKLKAITAQCHDIKTTIDVLDSKFVNLAKKADETKNYMLLTEGTALKRSNEEKQELLTTLENKVTELKKQKLSQ